MQNISVADGPVAGALYLRVRYAGVFDLCILPVVPNKQAITGMSCAQDLFNKSF